jgi:hypothetical protein
MSLLKNSDSKKKNSKTKTKTIIIIIVIKTATSPSFFFLGLSPRIPESFRGCWPQGTTLLQAFSPEIIGPTMP